MIENYENRNEWYIRAAVALLDEYHISSSETNKDLTRDAMEQFKRAIKVSRMPMDICIRFIAYLEKQLANPGCLEKSQATNVKTYPCLILAIENCDDKSYVEQYCRTPVVTHWSDVQIKKFIDDLSEKLDRNLKVKPTDIIRILGQLNDQTIRHDFTVAILEDAATLLTEGKEYTTDLSVALSELKRLGVNFISDVVSPEHLETIDQLLQNSTRKTAGEKDALTCLNEIMSLLPNDANIFKFLKNIDPKNQFLLKHEKEINNIVFAAKINKMDLLDSLLKKGAPSLEHGKYALLFAMKNNNLVMCDLLAKTDSRFLHQLLIHAVENSPISQEAFNWLLKQSIDVNYKYNGESALFIAAKLGDVEKVKALLDIPDIDFQAKRTPSDEKTALQIAEDNGNTEIVDLLSTKLESHAVSLQSDVDKNSDDSVIDIVNHSLTDLIHVIFSLVDRKARQLLNKLISTAKNHSLSIIVSILDKNRKFEYTLLNETSTAIIQAFRKSPLNKWNLVEKKEATIEDWDLIDDDKTTKQTLLCEASFFQDYEPSITNEEKKEIETNNQPDDDETSEWTLIN